MLNIGDPFSESFLLGDRELLRDRENLDIKAICADC